MFRTILALLLFAAMTLAAMPQASAQACYSDRSCSGKKLSAKTCASCLRGDGKSWQTASGTCLKSCPTKRH